MLTSLTRLLFRAILSSQFIINCFISLPKNYLSYFWYMAGTPTSQSLWGLQSLMLALLFRVLQLLKPQVYIFFNTCIWSVTLSFQTLFSKTTLKTPLLSNVPNLQSQVSTLLWIRHPKKRNLPLYFFIYLDQPLFQKTHTHTPDY